MSGRSSAPTLRPPTPMLRAPNSSVRRRAPWAAIALVVLATVGCHTAKSAQTCPDGARTRCLTAPACSYDATRGCEVCHCADPGYVPPQQTPPK